MVRVLPVSFSHLELLLNWVDFSFGSSASWRLWRDLDMGDVGLPSCVSAPKASNVCAH